MELELTVIRAEVKEEAEITIGCKAQAGSESHECACTIHSPPSVLSDSQPKMAFQFTSTPTEVSLRFTVQNSQSQSSHLCTGEDYLVTPPVIPEERKSRVVLLKQKVTGTDIESFAGKLKYSAHFKATHAPVNGIQFVSTLLKEETDRLCDDGSFSLDNSTVSVTFHCTYTTANPLPELVGIARIGERMNAKTASLLQCDNSPHASLQCVSLLKEVRLLCQDFECLELLIVDVKSGGVLFSSSLARNQLVPFQQSHLQYDSSWMKGKKEQSVSFQSTSQGPSVLATVLYLPPRSNFRLFTGLEVALNNIRLPATLQHCNECVIGVQLIHKNSKGKFPSLSGSSSQPPFRSNVKKGCAPSNYYISLLKHSNSDPSSTSTVYIFYPEDNFFSSQDKSGFYLVFHIYACSTDEIWWESTNVASGYFEVSESQLSQIRSQKVQFFQSELSTEPAPPDPHQGIISGILRWKTNQDSFLSKSTLADAPHNSTVLPDTSSHPTNTQYITSLLQPTESLTHPPEPPNRSNHMVHQEPRVPSDGILDPTLFRDVLKGIVTPNEAADNQRSETSSQLGQLESTLRRMASDFRILRRENQRLQADNEQLQLEMGQLKSTIAVDHQEQSRLESLSASDLILRIGALQRRLTAEERTSERFRNKIQSLKSHIHDEENLIKELVQLKEAHESQQKLVHFLRGKVDKYRKCSELCQKQETIITQLESLLAKQAQGHPSAKDDAISLLGKENAGLRSMLLYQHQTTTDTVSQQVLLMQKDQTIQSLESELSKYVRRCQHLEMELSQKSVSRGGSSDMNVFELEQKLLVSDAKVEALTKQLQENAKSWISQKTHYEVQLAECRSRLDTLIRSGQEALGSNRADGQLRPREDPSQREEESQCVSYRKLNKSSF